MVKFLKVCECYYLKEEVIKLLLVVIEKLCCDVDIFVLFIYFNILFFCVGELVEEVSKVICFFCNNFK